jgi:hypothetical protein
MEEKIYHEQLLSSLKVLVAHACKTGAVDSQIDADSVTIKLRFGKGTGGELALARSVAALMAQETM